MEKEKAVIYQCLEWGKERFFVTWDKNEKGEPIGGHEIGPVDENPLVLLSRLNDLLDEDLPTA